MTKTRDISLCLILSRYLLLPCLHLHSYPFIILKMNNLFLSCMGRQLHSYKVNCMISSHVFLLTFQGRIKAIQGSNPERQPTPNHDCHVSKLFMNLTSSATHSEIYGASMVRQVVFFGLIVFILNLCFYLKLQLYFYEIDENSNDFQTVKQPRQVLPYAVLTLSISKPEVPQPRSDIVEVILHVVVYSFYLLPLPTKYLQFLFRSQISSSSKKEYWHRKGHTVFV